MLGWCKAPSSLTCRPRALIAAFNGLASHLHWTGQIEAELEHATLIGTLLRCRWGFCA